MFLAGAAAIAIAEEEARDRHIRVRQLRIRWKEIRDTSNPFQMDPEYFRKLYRMTPDLAIDLIELLRPHIERHNHSSITIHVQVLCALRFFAEGGYQKGVGQDHHHPVSQSTVSRCLDRVTNALVDIAPRFIRLPSTREERQQVQHRFREHINIRGILGLIDCFLVAFVRPCENEEAFYNYKGYHAMNVQVICDADFIIRNVRCCPGSNNDRFVWEYSEAKEYFHQLRQDERITREEGCYYLIGDSGYTPSPILLTPIRNAAEGTSEARYTLQIVSTRCRVKQTFGILTGRWRGIKRERKLCYRDPEKVAKFITASAVLHNYCILHGPLPDVQHNDEVPDANNVNVIDMGYHAGVMERQRILEVYDA